MTRCARRLLAPARGIASCVRLSCTASLPCTPLVAASYITWGIMREPSDGGGFSSLIRPAHNPRYAKCRAARDQVGGCVPVSGARRSVGSCVRGAHLFIVTATSPAHHWARRSGPPAYLQGLPLWWSLTPRGRRAHGRRVVPDLCCTCGAVIFYRYQP